MKRKLELVRGTSNSITEESKWAGSADHNNAFLGGVENCLWWAFCTASLKLGWKSSAESFHQGVVENQWFVGRMTFAFLFTYVPTWLHFAHARRGERVSFENRREKSVRTVSGLGLHPRRRLCRGDSRRWTIDAVILAKSVEDHAPYGLIHVLPLW